MTKLSELDLNLSDAADGRARVTSLLFWNNSIFIALATTVSDQGLNENSDDGALSDIVLIRMNQDWTFDPQTDVQTISAEPNDRENYITGLKTDGNYLYLTYKQSTGSPPTGQHIAHIKIFDRNFQLLLDENVRSEIWGPDGGELRPSIEVMGNRVFSGQSNEHNTGINAEVYVYEKGATNNQPPALGTIGDKVVTEGATLTFTISATDPDNDPLTYTATNLPSGATFSSQTFTWTPTSEQVGTYTDIHFEVTDGTLTDSENITITVNVSNLPDLSGAWSNISKKKVGTRYRVSGKLTVNNTGTQKASGVKVKVYLSDNAIYELSDQYLGSTTMNINANSSASKTIIYMITGDPTNKYLIALIDPDNTIQESNENNNIGVSNVIP